MFRYFAENIAFMLIRKNILNIRNRDIYAYGIEVILLNSILLMSLLGISIIGNNLMFFGEFLLFFVPIRTFAGGYHAKHSETCLAISIGIYSVAMIIYNRFPNLYRSVFAICLFIVAIVILIVESPLKNPKHPLADYQYRRNRVIVYGIITIYVVLFVIFSITNYTIASGEVIFTILVSVLLIVGKLEEHKENYI